MPTETLVRVDENDVPIGRVSRKEAHSRTDIIHREVGLLVADTDKTVVLFQKRSLEKKVLPGFWSTGVAGHVEVLNMDTPNERNETPDDTIIRETLEEINADISIEQLIYLGKERFTFDEPNRIESHFKYWYVLEVEDPQHFLEGLVLDKEEVEAVAFWNRDEISQNEKDDKISLYGPFLKVVKMYLDKSENYLTQSEGDSHAKIYR